MLTQHTIQIREADPQEDGLIAEHFYAMWLDNAIPTQAINPDWQNIISQFIDQARRNLSYKAFVAEVGDRVVGSAGCQLFAGLYPPILTADYRQDGYIWGVYVEPPYRQQGIATRLTQRAIAHLKAIGCTRALLNASPSGKPIYNQLGFLPSNSMYLDLTSTNF